MASQGNTSSISHSSFLLGQIPKLSDTNRVDWLLGLKTYLKGRRLWKHLDRDTSLSEDDAKDLDKVEQLECERATVLEVIRSTISPTRLPIIRGIEDPKRAYEILIDRVSQDDGLEVASLIAKVATIRYNGSDPVSSFLDGINDLHTQLAEATSDDPDLKISDKLLAVFLLLSFPGDQFVTICDQLFGELKTLTTAKVVSRMKTKSALNQVDESVTAMAAVARPSANFNSRSITPRTDKSAGAPCYLKEHWAYPHTNGVCSKQQHRKGGPPQRSNPNSHTSNPANFSDAEKVKRFNQMAAAGIIGFNSEAQPSCTNDQNSSNTNPPVSQPPQSTPSADCQYATSYNVVADESPVEPLVKLSTQYPTPSATHKPTLADTACNRHMFGDALMLDNIHDIDPVSIKVANDDESSRIIATKMGTARLYAFGIDGTPTFIDIPNILYSPSLPANLISITQLYDSGYKTVDPHYGSKNNDLNLYYSNSRVILPAYEDEGPGGFWRFFHYSEPRACSTISSPSSATDLWHLRFGHLNKRSTHDIMESVL